MKKEKSKAIALRKAGLSYSQIGQELKVAKSTLSFWLKDVKMSARLRQKLDQRANKTSREALIRYNKSQTVLAAKRAAKIRIRASREAKDLMSQTLFVTGVALYWAEGYKRGAKGSKWKSFDLANSDPEIIKLMIKFIKKYLSEYFNKISIQIIGHNNINITKAVNYWSNLTGVNKSNFIRTTVYSNLNSKGIRNKKRLPYGTIHLRINSVAVFFRMIGWIETIKKTGCSSVG